jgi:hypothetical protein
VIPPGWLEESFGSKAQAVESHFQSVEMPIMLQSFAQVDASDTPLRSRNVSHIASDSGHLP